MKNNKVSVQNSSIIMVLPNKSGISAALEQMDSKNKETQISRQKNTIQFTFWSIHEYSRSLNPENQLEKTKVDGVDYFKYKISFFEKKYSDGYWYLVSCKFASALKEFIVKNLESALDTAKKDFKFLEIDLLGVKIALENGTNLKGTVKAITSGLDYFGDNGLEKIVLRGDDVFLSKKYNAIWEVLTKGVKNSLVLHSVALLFDVGYKDLRVALDKFGNMRMPLDGSLEELEAISSIMAYLMGFSIQRNICPLRRIAATNESQKDDDEV